MLYDENFLLLIEYPIVTIPYLLSQDWFCGAEFCWPVHGIEEDSCYHKVWIYSFLAKPFVILSSFPEPTMFLQLSSEKCNFFIEPLSFHWLWFNVTSYLGQLSIFKLRRKNKESVLVTIPFLRQQHWTLDFMVH